MSVATLHAVIKACQKPAGGLKALAVVDPLDLDTQPVWHLEPTIASLSFLPGKAAFAFQADQITARLSDKTSVTASPGDYIDYFLQARVSGISPEMEYFRAKLLNRRVHIVATYQNDLQRFVPWMRIFADGDSGSSGNRNAYSFSGSARLHKPAPFLDATFDVISDYNPPAPVGEEGTVTLVEITTEDSQYAYIIPVGKWLVGWEVRSDEAQSVSLGTVALGDELGGPVDLLALQVWVGQGNMLSTFTSNTIHFSGLAGTNTIKLWLLG